MSKKSYAAKFKDPRWQKKRLEVLEAAGFTCHECSADDQELHVHHRRYVKDAEPWEYTCNELVALCDTCHAELHALLDEIKALLGQTTNSGQLMRVAGYITAVVGRPEPALYTVLHYSGFADYYRAAPFTVYALSYRSMFNKTPFIVPDALMDQVITMNEDDE